MQISSRFTIAVHVLICMETFQNERKVTSDFLASSVNVNPVVIRRLLQQLKKAGIIDVKRGSGGSSIAKDLREITLLDVYNAVESVDGGQLFRFHDNPNPLCPVGRNIHHIMDKRLEQIQEAMELQMRAVTIHDMMEDARRWMKEEPDAEKK